MYQPIILSSAKNDIHEAAQWYNKQQKGLGKKFTKIVRNKVDAIKQNPFAYSVKYGNVRTAVLDIFPFMIHFTIRDKIILVSAVLHTSRDPGVWMERK